MLLIREEQIKADKHPFDAWDDLVRASNEGFATIQPESFLRFRWFGLYQQRPKTDPYFMLRVKLPGGHLRAAQLRKLAVIARDYGRGIADITTRQNFQFHWLLIDKIPEILSGFEAVGITTRGACGDVTRNITGAPLSGLEPDEVDDLQDVIEALHKELIWNKNFANLPRKFKISITGSLRNSALPEINDVGIYGFWRNSSMREPSFAIRVGGGLSGHPVFSQPLPIALRRRDIIPATMATLAIFRDLGNRGNRHKARLKFLVEDWGAEKFLEAMEAYAKQAFERVPSVPLVQSERENFWGIIPQKQSELYAIGLTVPAGRLTAQQMFKIADLSERYASGDLRTTCRQNILLINVPQRNLKLMEVELLASGFSLGTKNIDRSLVVCTGKEFCSLALVEVKAFAKNLIRQLASIFPDFREMITIHVAGCPNSCGQYQIADIGLLGAVRVLNGVKQDAFHVSVGARLGERESWNRLLFKSVIAEDVPDLVERIIRAYITHRRADEEFRVFCARFDDNELKEFFSNNGEQ